MKYKSNAKRQTGVTLVIGGGYVGLPLALLVAKKGKKVVIYDKSERKCKQLATGISGINRNLDHELEHYIKNNSTFILRIMVLLWRKMMKSGYQCNRTTDR